MSKYQGLTDEQWAILEPLPASEASSVRGRHPVHDDRPVPNGILWVLRTGAAWADLPERFPVLINLLSPIRQVGQNGRIPKHPRGTRP